MLITIFVDHDINYGSYNPSNIFRDWSKCMTKYFPTKIEEYPSDIPNFQN